MAGTAGRMPWLTFLAAKGDPVLLKDWTNTVLGQTWQEQGETVDHELLYQTS